MAKSLEVERVAETHFMIRPMLRNALRNSLITPEGQSVLSVSADNYLELWEGTYADRWFDMGTFVRLGTAIETGLREFHGRLALSATPPGRGIFQRLVDPVELEQLFRRDCGVEISSCRSWTEMREIMLHRHLFAHRSGLVDDQYIKNLAMLTGVDILPDVVASGYPVAGVHWLRPLSRLNEYIEHARRFFRDLP